MPAPCSRIARQSGCSGRTHTCLGVLAGTPPIAPRPAVSPRHCEVPIVWWTVEGAAGVLGSEEVPSGGEHRRYCYRSCRDRHCPKCQGPARAAWLAKRRDELLDCEYHHVVFTLPAEIAADPRHLGAEIGFLAVLHSWGSNLSFHPHLHCVVPGGGLAPSGDRWIACRPGFFLPVRVLSRRFRTLFLKQLEHAFRQGSLRLEGSLASLAETAAFDQYLAPLRKREWVVYSKPPFDGPARVVDYLGRYTHRVAISNDRLLAVEDGAVRFRWKDCRQPHRRKAMTLPAEEFMRRFLTHVLPRDFHRIRHFGLLANCHRKKKLALCRRLLGMPPPATDPPPDYRDLFQQLTGESLDRCPACRRGLMVCVETFEPGAQPPLPEDTS